MPDDDTLSLVVVVQVPVACRTDIMKRARDGESVREIAAFLGLPLSTTYYYARAYCKKQSHIAMEKLSSKEKGYLVGMVVGDGSLIRNAYRGEFLVKIALDEKRDQDILGFLLRLLGQGGKKITLGRERGMVILRVWSKQLFQFILRYVQLNKRLMSRHYEKHLVRPESWDREFVMGFTGRLIDSDGHIEKNAHNHGGAGIATSSVFFREQAQSLLRAHGIDSSWHVSHRDETNTNPRFVLRIGSKRLHNLCDEILSVKHERFHGGPGRN